MIRALEGAKSVIAEVGAEYGELSGRAYGVLDEYLLDDADVAIVAMSGAAGTARVVADGMRAEGVKAGVLRIRSYRPFPVAEVVAALQGIKAVAVLDRASSPGAVLAPIASDICAAFYNQAQRPTIVNYVFGLGGRDLSLEHVASVFERLTQIVKTGEVGPALSYLGLRDG
jgi:pyruvate ferredoxin oxidoreductase alpha subunit